MRAVREKKPKYFIWENVKGALSSNKGRDFAFVLNEMAEAGYSLWWQVLNAKDFGVPQNRERIFVVGFRDGGPREIFFERGTAENNIKVVGELNSETWKKRNESIRRVHSPAGIAPTTPTGTGGGVMTKIIEDFYPSRIRQYDENSPTLRSDRIGLKVAIDKNNGEFKEQKDVSHCIDKSYYKGFDNHGQRTGVCDDSRIRRLTPIECERLMGLPDNWTKYGVGVSRIDIYNEEIPNEISDSQRYKMCGNGVVVNVVEEIIKQILLK